MVADVDVILISTIKEAKNSIEHQNEKAIINEKELHRYIEPLLPVPEQTD